MLAVTVEFHVKPQHVDAFHNAVLQQAEASLQNESACRQFDVCVDLVDRTHVFLYEIYDNQAAFDEHLQTSHFDQFNKTVSNWVESKQVATWQVAR